MVAHVDVIGSLLKRFDSFYQTLDAATIPTAKGGRKVAGVPHAVAMSEATDALFAALEAANDLLRRTHGRRCEGLPTGLTLYESDSPDDLWTAVPAEEIIVHAYPIG